MVVSGNLEDLKLKIFLARRQPWWRLTRFGPPNIRNVPTPQEWAACRGMWGVRRSDGSVEALKA